MQEIASVGKSRQTSFSLQWSLGFCGEIRPEIKEIKPKSNRRAPKNIFCFPLLFHPTANEEFQPKICPVFRHSILPYSTLCQPILPILTPSFFTGYNQGSLFIAIFHSKPLKAVQSHSRFFETIFFNFYESYPKSSPPQWRPSARTMSHPWPNMPSFNTIFRDKSFIFDKETLPVFHKSH